MAGDRQPDQIVDTRPIRVQRTVKCHNCGNDNLKRGGSLAKMTQVMMIGGPGQPAPVLGEEWAVYECLACEAVFPYPKSYSGQPQLQAMYQVIFNWCEAQCKLREQRSIHLEKLVSIIESNRDLLGLPGQRDDDLSETLAPIVDRIDHLETALKTKKGGRPKHCKVKECKTNAGPTGYCEGHAMEVNNE